MLHSDVEMQARGLKMHVTFAFHMVMVAVSPGGTRMIGTPFAAFLCCDAVGRSDLCRELCMRILKLY